MQPWAVPAPTLSAPSRKAPEREADDPEGNLAIVERVVHESQRLFPYWEHSWDGTAHRSASTPYDAPGIFRALTSTAYVELHPPLRFTSAHFPAFTADSPYMVTHRTSKLNETMRHSDPF